MSHVKSHDTCRKSHGTMRDVTHDHDETFTCDMTWSCVTSLILLWREVCQCGPWLIHMWSMTHSHVVHDSFTCGPWLIYMWSMTHSHVVHDSFSFFCDVRYVNESRTISDMPHSSVWLCVSHRWMRHVPYGKCVTCLIHLWHESLRCVVWHDVSICYMPHSYVWHDSFIRGSAYILHSYVLWLAHM